MATKFLLIPEDIFRGLTTSSDTGNINLDFTKKEMENVRRKKDNPTAKNINYNQELRRYLHLRKEEEDKPVNVALAATTTGLPPINKSANAHPPPPPSSGRKRLSKKKKIFVRNRLKKVKWPLRTTKFPENLSDDNESFQSAVSSPTTSKKLKKADSNATITPSGHKKFSPNLWSASSQLKSKALEEIKKKGWAKINPTYKLKRPRRNTKKNN